MRKFILFSLFLPSLLIAEISLSREAAIELGHRVWQNESGGRVEGLTWWNPNEDFASMGIGHFLWFPKDQKGRYQETFPQLLKFMKQRGVKLPNWLNKENVACPWQTKAQFDQAFHGKKMRQLRQLLQQTVSIQAAFIAYRLEGSLPRLMKASDGSQQEHIQTMFTLLTKSPQGIYALADYINFKGEGLHTNETWGLKHVLLLMPENTRQEKAVWEFVRAAKKLLLKRVLENPSRSDERRWLLGWKNRLDSYLSAN